jgi:hypothetical protein
MAYELVTLDAMVGELRRAKGIGIAIFDACRDNGAEQRLKRGMSSRGAAAVDRRGGRARPVALRRIRTILS